MRNELQEQKRAHEREVADLRRRQDELEEVTQEQQDEWRRKVEQHQKYEIEAKVAKEQTDKMWKELTQHADQCKQMQRDAEEKARRATESMQRCDDLEREKQHLKGELQERLSRGDDLERENQHLKGELQARFSQGDKFERENRHLKDELQDLRTQIFSLENQIQQEKSKKTAMTPGEMVRILKRSDELHQVRSSADLAQEVSALKEDMKWLAWHNDILCRNMPKDRSQVVEKQVGEGVNPMNEDWQIPKYLMDFLGSAKQKAAASRGASLGGS